MRPELRPLSLGEVLDRTFQIYRSYLLPFVTIGMFGGIVGTFWATLVAMVQRFGLGGVHGRGAVMRMSLLGVLGWPVALLAYAVVAGALVLAVGQLYQQKSWTAGSVLRAAFSRWSTLLGLGIVVALLSCGLLLLPSGGLLAITAVAPKIATANGARLLTLSYAAFGFGMLFVLPLCIWIGLRYSLALPVCSFELATIRQSLRRSALLSRGLRWRILAMAMIYVVIAAVLGSAVLVPAAFLVRGAAAHQPLWFTVYSLLVGFVIRAVSLPILGIGMAVFYFDSRIRNEGLDVTWSLAGAEPQPEFPDPLIPGEGAAIG
jgi:hypothetical protein